MGLRGALAIVALTAVHQTAVANEQRIDCPPDIPRASLRIDNPPKGWVAFVPFEYRAPLPLVYATVMAGPPSEMGELKPEGGKPDELAWLDLRPMPGGIWMACIYGDTNQHDYILSTRLSDATKQCIVKSKPKAGWKPGKTLDIRCR